MLAYCYYFFNLAQTYESRISELLCYRPTSVVLRSTVKTAVFGLCTRKCSAGPKPSGANCLSSVLSNRLELCSGDPGGESERCRLDICRFLVATELWPFWESPEKKRGSGIRVTSYTQRPHTSEWSPCKWNFTVRRKHFHLAYSM